MTAWDDNDSEPAPVRDARDDDETDRLANDLAGDWRDCLPMRRPEQPPPDALGGQPPAEPENP